jgi:hypothetical protein
MHLFSLTLPHLLPLSFFQCFLARKYCSLEPYKSNTDNVRPIQGYWTPGLGICLDEGKTTLANGVVNTVADLLTTSLPIPMIWGLRMPIGQKIGVMILLGLGFIVTIAGVVRFAAQPAYC